MHPRREWCFTSDWLTTRDLEPPASQCRTPMSGGLGQGVIPDLPGRRAVMPAQNPIRVA